MSKTNIEQTIADISERNAEQGRPPVNMAAGRRAFMRTAGLATLGAATLGGLAAGTTPAAAQAANVDVQILNFALNLEYLEAEFYVRAHQGTGLGNDDLTGLGPQGPVTGGSKVPFQDATIAAYAEEIAADELAHVRFLRAVLGSAAVAEPAIDLATSFTTAARAGNLIGPNDTFDPFADDASFLLGAYIFEDVGVTAYHGAAPLVTNKTILDYASGILAVEAYHAGLVRTLCFSKGLFQQTAQISRLRYFLDGTGNDDQGVGPDQATVTGGPPTAANIVPTDNTARVFSRTPKQVLSIVYGNQAANPGLFFPNGANAGPGDSIFG